MTKNFGTALSNEYEFVLDVLNRYSYLSDRKIEFIKKFRDETGYTLKQSLFLVDVYLGGRSGNIWNYIRDEIDIPRDRPSITPSPANPPSPQLYIVVYSGRVEYTAHSLDEARRVVELLNGLDRYGSKIYSQVQ